MRLRLQVARYRWRFLTTKTEKAWIVTGLFLFATSVVTLVIDWRGSLIFSLLGVASIIVPVVRRAVDNRGRKAVLYRVNESELVAIAEGLELPIAMVEAGYEIDAEALTITSREVNARLRQGDDWGFEYSGDAVSRQREFLLSDGFRFEATNALLAFMSESLASGKVLTNDRKVGLVSAIPPPDGTILLKETDYFTTLITNDLASRVMRDRKEQQVLAGTSTLYPGIDENGERLRFVDLPSAPLSNHIGASMLGITSDLKLVLWVQGHRAMVASGELVPTGSGSCDVRDFSGSSFVDSIRHTMQRELNEESSRKRTMPSVSHVNLEDIWVIGHARNLARGGKPEFFGIARLQAASHEIVPDIDELVADRMVLQCSDLTELRGLCSRLLASSRPSPSLILRTNLRMVIEACDEDPERASSLLFSNSTLR